MDHLLGGYGSDSSSSSAISTHSPPATVAASTCAPQQQQQLVNSSNITVNEKTAFDATTDRKQMQSQRLKLLKLSAVLPPEIFDQLIKAQNKHSRRRKSKHKRKNGSGASSSSGTSSNDEFDSDFSESSSIENTCEDRKMNKRRGSSERNVEKSNHQQEITAGGGGSFGSLLNDLRSAKMAPVKNKKSNDDQEEKKSTNKKSDTQKEVMGEAFTTTTSTKIVSKRKRPKGTGPADMPLPIENKVVDIHGISYSPNLISSSSQENINETASPETVSSKDATLAALALSSPLNQKKCSTSDAAAPRMASSDVNNTQMKCSIPRIRSTINRTATPATIAPPSTIPISNAVENHYHSSSSSSIHHQPTTRAPNKREMERLLRAGQFDQIPQLNEGHHTVHQMQQVVPQYNINPNHAAHDVSSFDGDHTNPSGKKSGVSVKMYNPSTGERVSTNGEISIKERSKHQINQLANSALALRGAARTQAQFGVGITSIKKGSASRNGAKRKYGW